MKMRVGFSCINTNAPTKNVNKKVEKNNSQQSFKAALLEILCTSERAEVQRVASYIIKREWDSMGLVLNFLRKDQGSNVLFKKLLEELIPLIPGADETVLTNGFTVKTNLKMQVDNVKKCMINSGIAGNHDIEITRHDGSSLRTYTFSFTRSDAVGEELILNSMVSPLSDLDIPLTRGLLKSLAGNRNSEKILSDLMGTDNEPKLLIERLIDIPLNYVATRFVQKRYMTDELTSLTGLNRILSSPGGIILPNTPGEIPKMQEWVNLGTAWKKIITFLDSNSDQVDFANSFHFKQ